MTNYYHGYDPGQSGGIAVLDDCGIVILRKMPATERDLWELVDNLPHGHAIIEKVQGRPGNSSVATFKFGQNYGFLRACIVAAEIPFEEIIPRSWQKALGVVPKKKTETNTQWKNRLKGLAQQLFPEAHITLNTADALLIAEFCRRLRSS